jgi:hypothetical protein
MLWASAKPAIANISMSWGYNIMLKRIAASLFALALAVSPALAGSSTIAVTPGSGATYQVITNGGGNFVGMFGLCDGVAAAQCIAVKAASTAALAADPSLVVTISPNTAALPVSGTFWQTTQPVSGTFWQTTQPISAASLPLPTGASTAAGLSAINTTLGSPFQAGGSIGNTSFAATQSGSWSLVNISGTVSLPTGAATSANQTNASQKTQIVDGSGNVIASTSNNLDVQCANCSGSGVSTADGASWTAGTSLFAGIGGAYQTTATSNPLTAGDQGFAQLTHYRALMAAWFNSSGTEMGTSGSPVQVSLANTGANGTAVAISATSLPLPTNAAAETGGNLATLAGAVTASVVQSNAKQVNGVTTLAGAGATGTGSQRVTAAQDTTTIAGSAPGTAGSASTNVVTVQGIASMTPLLANPGTAANWAILADNAAWTAGTTPQAAMGCEYTSGGATALTTGHIGTPGCTSARQQFAALFGNAGAIMDFAGQNASSPANSLLIGGQFNTTPTTITSGNSSPFQLDNAGNLLVNVKAGGGSGGTSLADNAAWTAGATAQTPIGCEYTSGGATALTTGHVGTPGCTSTRAILSDKSSVGGTALSAAVSAYGAAPTGTEVEGVNAFVTNTNANGQTTMSASSPVTIASDQSAVAVKAASGAFVAGAIADLAHGQGTMSASVPVAIASNQSSIPMALNTTPTVANGNGVVPSAGATNGATPYFLASAASTNATNVKASAGTLYHISIQNKSGAIEYILFFNSASAPTCTGTAVYEITVPSTSATIGGGIVEDFAVGMQFTTGIGICATTAIGGTGSVAANDLTINLTYK